jgi:hypothetical protein
MGLGPRKWIYEQNSRAVGVGGEARGGRHVYLTEELSGCDALELYSPRSSEKLILNYGPVL